MKRSPARWDVGAGSADQPRWTQWPENCAPSNSPVYALNELRMSVPAHVAWAWLVRAPLWPGWYANSRDVSILEGADQQRLSAGSRFRWRTSNTLWRPVETTVDICEPPAKLGWGGDGLTRLSLLALRPDGDGCHVVTEECQAGALPSLGRSILKRGLVKHHQRWLEGLEQQAMEGPPP